MLFRYRLTSMSWKSEAFSSAPSSRTENAGPSAGAPLFPAVRSFQPLAAPRPRVTSERASEAGVRVSAQTALPNQWLL